MAMPEKIRILFVKSGNLLEAELARRLGSSPQNPHSKMKQDNFTESDLQKIADVLGCKFEAGVRIGDSGEVV